MSTGPQAEEPEVMPDGPPARRPRSCTALIVDTTMGAIGGIIISFLVWSIVAILDLAEGEPSVFLFIGAALGGAVSGVIVGLSYRDWLFLRVFELKIFFRDPWGCGVPFALVSAVIIALAESVWVVMLAFLWIAQRLSGWVRKLVGPAADEPE